MGGSGGTSGEDTERREDDDDSQQPDHQKGKGAAPPSVPSRHTRVGPAAGMREGRWAAWQVTAASPAPAPGPGLPAHHGASLPPRHCAASRATRPHPGLGPGAPTRGPPPPRSGGGRRPPAPQDPRPSGARGSRAPTLWRARSPPHCPRLSRKCPGRPAPGSAGWLQTRCPPPSRRRGLRRRRQGPRAWGPARRPRRREQLPLVPPAVRSEPEPGRAPAPPRPARPGPAHRAGGGTGVRAQLPAHTGRGAERAGVWEIGGLWDANRRRGARGEPWNPRQSRTSAPCGSLKAATCRCQILRVFIFFWITGHAILHVGERF